MVTGEDLSSGLPNAGSAVNGFRLQLPQRPLSLLSQNEFIRLDVETPTHRRHGIGVIHRRLARLEYDRPQLGEFLTPVVKIGKTVPAKDGFADPIASPGQTPAKACSESSTVPAGVMAIPRGGNLVRQIALCRVALDRVMAADKIERADEAAVAPTIAQAAFDPALAVAEELQQQIEGLRRLRPGRARS